MVPEQKSSTTQIKAESLDCVKGLNTAAVEDPRRIHHHDSVHGGEVGAFGQKHSKMTTCSVPHCQGSIHKEGLCQVHHSSHFYDLAMGGRSHGGLDFGLDKCIVKGCGGDVYKKTLCMEHYSESERDLVDSVEIELQNVNNPWAKERAEEPHKVLARERRKAEQERKDKEALEACRIAKAEREAMEKMRRKRDIHSDAEESKRIEDAERKLKEEEEQELSRKAEEARLKREAAAVRQKQLDDEAEAEEARKRKDAATEAERIRRERLLKEEEESAAAAAQLLELEMLRAQKEKELEKYRREMEEEEITRVTNEKDHEALSKSKTEEAKEHEQERRAARVRKKEEERMRKELEIRAATDLAYRENKAATDKNKSGLLKSEVNRHLVRDDCLTVDEKARFSGATTYAEAYQEWHTTPGSENALEGIIGIAEDHSLVRSSDWFTAWKTQSAKVDRDGQSKMTALAIDCMLRAGKGRYYVASASRLYSLNPSTGLLRAPMELKVDGVLVKALKALCTSQSLHQKHKEEVFGIVKNGSIPGIVGDSICNVDLETGNCTVIFTTHRTDLVALTAPPLSGGPWHGIVFFYWSLVGGLTAVHWANQDYAEKHIGAGGPIEGGGIHALTFSTGGQLYAVGDAIHLLDPHTAAVLSTIHVPIPLKAAVWEPAHPSLPLLKSAAPSPHLPTSSNEYKGSSKQDGRTHESREGCRNLSRSPVPGAK